MTAPTGWTAPGWDRVADAFRQNFATRNEVGAAFTAYHRGRKVVDLWGGLADEKTGRPWDEDTMVVVYSTTKGATALTAHLLAQRGELQMAAPVSEYWPAFAQNGKDAVTVDHLMSHRAGLPWVDAEVTLEGAFAWDPVVRALEVQAPVWEPGTAHGYHATTYGWLVGEVVRRVSGASLGQTFRREVAEPLGIDFYIGLPDSEEHRVASLVSIIDAIASGRISFGSSTPDASGGSGTGAAGAPGGADQADNAYLQALAEKAMEYMAPDGPLNKALSAPSGVLADQTLWESPELRRAEIPAANGIGTARAVAAMYSACINEVQTDTGDKVRLLDDKQLDDALRQRTEGPDKVLLGLDIQWGLGFMVNRGIIGAAGLGGPRSFGHFGMGGSMGWADPDAELAVSYVMNRMDIGTTGDRRAFSLASACYEVLGS
ncbi:MAG TPA: serine hydrolase domain-containing protein [Acidimicrobiales bacterium]|nr:serine hydrolase domain-containing protein [Acidimicrobiales bacterium]